MPLGTAAICDAGRTGSLDVGGRHRHRLPDRGVPDGYSGLDTRRWGRPELQGVLIDIRDDGKASSIERLRVACPRPEGPEDAHERDSASLKIEGTTITVKGGALDGCVGCMNDACKTSGSFSRLRIGPE
jgi:hypothetical protein